MVALVVQAVAVQATDLDPASPPVAGQPGQQTQAALVAVMLGAVLPSRLHQPAGAAL